MGPRGLLAAALQHQPQEGRLHARLTPLSFAEIFGVRELDSLGYHVVFLHDPTFSRFSRTPTCDRWTDGRMDRQTDATAYNSRAGWHRAGKNERVFIVLERCNPWPHVANRHVSISQLLSL